MRVFLLSPSLSEHYCVVNVWSRKDEWEVVSRLSVRAFRVLYSNMNGDIRHGVLGGRGAKEQCVSVCVCWEFHRLIACVS